MPTIVLYLRKGRTVDQKRALIRRMTDVVVEELKVDPKRVNMYFVEQEVENYGMAGVLKVDE